MAQQKKRRAIDGRPLKMGKLYKQLMGEGKTGKEAVALVNSAFETKIGISTMQIYGHNYMKSRLDPETSSEQVDESDPLEIRIRVIMKQMFQEMMTTMPTATSPVYEADMPPAPETIKGKHGKKDREYEKVSITVDKSLWSRFIQERNTSRLSSGRLMDKILWEYYGRPPLSYGSKDHQD